MWHYISLLPAASFSRYTVGTDMVTHRRLKDGDPVNTLSMESASIDRDQPVDWSGAGDENLRKNFAVNMRVTTRTYV